MTRNASPSGLIPRNQLFVFDAGEVFAHVLSDHPVRNVFAVPAVTVQRQLSVFLRKKVMQQLFGQDNGDRFGRIRIERLYFYVTDCGPYGQRGIRRQRPRRGRPRHEVQRPFDPFEQRLAFRVANDPELRRAGRVLHVAVAARLVQLVVAEPRAGGRRIGLYRISFIQQSLLVQLGEQEPQRLDVLVVVGDVRVVHVDPVPHVAGQPFPHVGIGHHLAAADAVVLLDRNFRADVLFGDAELLFDAQFDGQSVRVPSRFAVYEKTLLRFVAADDVLDRTRHDVVDPRRSVGRRGPS